MAFTSSATFDQMRISVHLRRAAIPRYHAIPSCLRHRCDAMHVHSRSSRLLGLVGDDLVVLETVATFFVPKDWAWMRLMSMLPCWSQRNTGLIVDRCYSCTCGKPTTDRPFTCVPQFLIHIQPPFHIRPAPLHHHQLPRQYVSTFKTN
jgi:hypothetical protein